MFQEFYGGDSIGFQVRPLDNQTLLLVQCFNSLFAQVSFLFVNVYYQRGNICHQNIEVIRKGPPKANIHFSLFRRQLSAILSMIDQHQSVTLPMTQVWLIKPRFELIFHPVKTDIITNHIEWLRGYLL